MHRLRIPALFFGLLAPASGARAQAPVPSPASQDSPPMRCTDRTLTLAPGERRAVVRLPPTGTLRAAGVDFAHIQGNLERQVCTSAPTPHCDAARRLRTEENLNLFHVEEPETRSPQRTVYLRNTGHGLASVAIQVCLVYVGATQPASPW